MSGSFNSGIIASGETQMARLVLEGTWKEIAAHADDFTGMRLKVIVEPETSDPQERDVLEEALRTRQEMAEFQARNPHLSESEAILRYGRCGPVYGMPFVDDLDTRPDDE